MNARQARNNDTRTQKFTWFDMCYLCIYSTGGRDESIHIINKDHKHSDLLSMCLRFSVFLSPKTSLQTLKLQKTSLYSAVACSDRLDSLEPCLDGKYRNSDLCLQHHLSGQSLSPVRTDPAGSTPDEATHNKHSPIFTYRQACWLT